ncbi:MAG TPA: class I adenylate-forming enzyme family protein [Acidimicrobiales bacterium]|nr:class I adenylate-forming enzyme family protein [Acidimicrobiales bacterium]
MIAAHADAMPDALALLSEEDGSRTYSELVERSAALAAALGKGLGVAPAERLCVWAVNQPAWAETYLAASAGLFATVAANPEWTDEEMAFILEHSETAVVICDAALAERAVALARRLGGVRHVVAIEADGVTAPSGAVAYEELLEMAPPDARALLPQGDDVELPAHIMYTSGTTAGRPKAVVGQITGSSPIDYHEMLGLGPAERGIVVTPFFHGNGMGGLTSALLYGASVVFPRRFSARRFWQLVDRYRPTYLWTLSPIVNILLGHPPGPHERRHDLRVGVVLGAAGAAALIEERFGFAVIDWYGMTEAGMGTYTRLGEERRPGSAGRRFPDSTMTILRDDGTEAEPGEVGEVGFRLGTITFDGYLKDEEATRSAVDGQFFRTGDLGYFDPEGYFFFVDRKKDIVRRGGENISSIEIETVMRAFPGVGDAAIVGKPDPVLGERVVAFVVPGTEGRPDPAEVQAHVAAHLAHFKVPEEILFIDELPRTATGKVIKKQLREQLPREAANAGG